MMTISEGLLTLSSSLELSIILKATLLLALGLTATQITARATASVRHLVLGTMFAALLALPLVISITPAIRVDIPVIASQTTQVVTPAPGPAIVRPATPGPGAPRRSAMPSWTSIARATWIGGILIQFLFLGTHLLRLRRIHQTGIPFLERRQFAQSLAIECGVRRRVDVLLHEGIPAPITCGMRHPAILLPFDARAWNDSELRRSLIHELEHIRRNDWATQLAARAAVALYWFHPLVWIAWRQLRLDAERASDDAVVLSAECTDYAEQLVGLARRMSKAHAEPALGMANRSDLSARVSALLDSTQRRGRAGLLTAASAIAVAGLALAVIAPLTAVAQSSISQNAGAQSRHVTALDRALYEAAEAGELQEIDSLVNAGAKVNAEIRGDGSPLIGAARRGQLAAVTRLLDRGADPNMPVAGDGNPLIMAAREGHTAVITLLLDRGARIDEVVPGDENALIQASGSGQLAAVKVLVSRGANVNARVWAEQRHLPGGGEWRSPLSVARRSRRAEVVSYLLSVGARE
jgi:bla regulator protein blaR1